VGYEVGAWDTLDITDQYIKPTYIAKSPTSFPIPDASYDMVLSGQVIEHVGPIWDWMRELARVCKPGGLVITINPVSWHYHEAPIDCWRIYPEGMKALCQSAGLDVLLSKWESLEMESARWLPGFIKGRKNVCLRLSGFLNLVGVALRLPIEGAFDTVTVARKT
jgi:SAM-dependent methyltransferase